MTRRSAIWRLPSPLATSRSTSVSRSVSRGAWGRPAPGSGPDPPGPAPCPAPAPDPAARAVASRRNSPSTRPASPGVNTPSPRPVRSTAASSSSRDADFSRYPVAPAFTVSSTSACSPLADSTRTRTFGYPATTRRVVSTPSRCGICRSRTTTSGRAAGIRRSASSPSAAVATTSRPASARSRATASRHIGWSSTTITRNEARASGVRLVGVPPEAVPPAGGPDVTAAPPGAPAARSRCPARGLRSPRPGRPQR